MLFCQLSDYFKGLTSDHRVTCLRATTRPFCINLWSDWVHTYINIPACIHWLHCIKPWTHCLSNRGCYLKQGNSGTCTRGDWTLWYTRKTGGTCTLCCTMSSWNCLSAQGLSVELVDTICDQDFMFETEPLFFSGSSTSTHSPSFLIGASRSISPWELVLTVLTTPWEDIWKLSRLFYILPGLLAILTAFTLEFTFGGGLFPHPTISAKIPYYHPAKEKSMKIKQIDQNNTKNNTNLVLKSLSSKYPQEEMKNSASTPQKKKMNQAHKLGLCLAVSCGFLHPDISQACQRPVFLPPLLCYSYSYSWGKKWLSCSSSGSVLWSNQPIVCDES